MNFIILLFTVALVVYAQMGSAQTATITGHVYDQSGNPLPGANIIDQHSAGTSTNVFGLYKLKVSPGENQFTVSYIGFETLSFTANLGSGQLFTKNVRLTPSDVQLSGVIIASDEAQTIESISAYDIKLRPIKTTQDVLRTVPGLFIAQHAGGGKAEQIFLRGFDIDHGTDITLSVDGMPVNMVSHAHGQGYSDLHFVIPETIEKVTFNKGPYYAEQGNFNTAGYAAFNTKTALDKSSVKVEGGPFGTIRAVSMIDLLDGKMPDQDLYIASEFYITDGYFESPQNFSRINFFSKYRSRSDDNSLLEISASTFTSSWDASGQIPVRAVESGAISRFGAIDDTEGGETSRSNINIKYVKPLNNSQSISQQLFFNKYDFNLVSNFTFYLNDPVNGDQITQAENRKIYGYRTSFLLENYLGSAKLTTEVGGALRYDDINDISLSHTVNRKAVLENLARGDINEINLNGFISETIDFDKLSVNGSLRYDYFIFNYVDVLRSSFKRQNVSKSVFSPKLRLNYKLARNVNIFAKAGVGFHSNDTRVVVAQNGNKILPKAYGLDIGATLKPSEDLIVTTALWYLDLEQEFVYVGDEGIVEPSGKTSRKGIDLSVRYQLLPWLYLDTDVNFTEPKSVEAAEGQDYIPLAPIFTSIGGMSFKFKNGLSGGLRYRYLGDRPANEDYSNTAAGYLLLDAALSYTRERFELGLSVENVLDTEWKEAQFETESRLRHEAESVSEIHFTPGSPLFVKGSVSFFFKQ